MDFLQLNTMNSTKIFDKIYTEKTYVFQYLYLNYAKVVPLIVPIFLSLSWSSRNFENIISV